MECVTKIRDILSDANLDWSKRVDAVSFVSKFIKRFTWKDYKDGVACLEIYKSFIWISSKILRFQMNPLNG